jgi:hypothetical protein
MAAAGGTASDGRLRAEAGALLQAAEDGHSWTHPDVFVAGGVNRLEEFEGLQAAVANEARAQTGAPPPRFQGSRPPAHPRQ